MAVQLNIIGPRKLIDEAGAVVWYIPGWLDKTTADNLERHLNDTLNWERANLTVWGKQVAEPRTTYVCGDAGIVHSYSGTHRPVNPWIPEIEALRNRINQETGARINSCLLNRYETGADYIGYHSDKELKGPNYLVVTITLGGSRDFYFRRKQSRLGSVNDIQTVLHSGDCVSMSGNTQRDWIHSLPKRARAERRISLTFREL